MEQMNRKLFLFVAAMQCMAATFAAEFKAGGVLYRTIDASSVYVPKQDYTETTLVIPATVTDGTNEYAVDSVGVNAFRDNAYLQSVTLGAKTIKKNAFCNCPDLASVTLQEGVESLVSELFSGTAIRSLHIPKSLTTFGESSSFNLPVNACYNLETITVAEENEKFCAVDGILYNKAKTKIVSCPVANTNFKGFLPEVTEVGRSAFFEHVFTVDTLVIPKKVNIIHQAFGNSTVNHLVIEGTKYGYNAFYGANIKTITLCDGFNKINGSFFQNVVGCESITILNGTMPDWENPSDSDYPCFSSDNGMFNVPLYVYREVKEDYEGNTGKWANFKNISELYPGTVYGKETVTRFFRTKTELESFLTGNTIVRFSSYDDIPSDWKALPNVVVDFKAQSILLSNKGGAYTYSDDFTAETAEFRLYPTVYADKNGGWMSVALPFSGVPTVEPFTAANPTGGKFWAKRFAGSTADALKYADLSASEFKANVPYLFAFPGDSYGENKFVSEYVAITANDAQVKSEKVASHYVDGPFEMNVAYNGITRPDAYILNEDGTKFVLTEEPVEAVPFTSYVSPRDPLPAPKLRSLGIIMDGYTSADDCAGNGAIVVYVSGGDIVISASEPGRTALYDMSGRVVKASVDYAPGLTRLSGLDAGAYVVAGRTVVLTK